ncbi:transglycosylase SLT domain-containing protein [Parafrankia discariae]|uniref:transglycosylase SLT domain-containing protein n=1 Tax=Parafrankia discariae TaxID=365528 RepID=UPI000371AC42|nr:transglycosylase SLT domain-containing protein [Parafrankia discariae]
MSAGGFTIAKAWVEVEPDTSGFDRELRTSLSRLRPYSVQVDGDLSPLRRSLASLPSVRVKVDGDLSPLRRSMSTMPPVRVRVDGDTTALRRSLAQVGPVRLDVQVNTTAARRELGRLSPYRVEIQPFIDPSRQGLGLGSRPIKVRVVADPNPLRVRVIAANPVRVYAEPDPLRVRVEGDMSPLRASMSRLGGDGSGHGLQWSRAFLYAAAGVLGSGGAMVGAQFAAGLVASIATASGALGTLPAMLSAAGQGLGAIKLGFSGVSDAIKAYGTAQDQAGAKSAASAASQRVSAASIRSANDAVADARRRVADAYEDADRQVTQANQRLQSAERTLLRSHEDLTRAQEDLTEARRDARRDLEELGRETERHGLTMRKAQLDVAEAKQRLDEVMADTSATELQREAARISYEESKNNLQDTTIRIQEQKDEYAELAAKGVDGSSQVVAAQRGVRDATVGVGDAQRGVAEAQAGVTQAQRDGAQRIEDAQRSLTRAVEAQADAQAAAAAQGVAGADAYAQALAKLPPLTREFVGYLTSIMPEFDRLKVASSNMFPGIETGLRALMTNLGIVEGGLERTALGFGRVAETAGRAFSGPAFRADLGNVMQSNAVTMENAGMAGVSFARALWDVVAVGAPIVEVLSYSARAAAENTAAWVSAKRESGELRRWMIEGISELRSWWNSIRDITLGVASLFSAVNDGATPFVDVLERGSASFRRWAESEPVINGVSSAFRTMRMAAGEAGGAVVSAAGDIAAGYQTGTISGNGLSAIFEGLGIKARGFANLARTEVAPTLVSLYDLFDHMGRPVAELGTEVTLLTQSALSTLLRLIRNDLVPIARDGLVPILRDDVVPVFRSLSGWIQDHVLPAVERVGDSFRDKMIPQLREIWQKVEDNKPGLQSLAAALDKIGQVAIRVAEFGLNQYFRGAIQLAGESVEVLISILAGLGTGFRLLSDGARDVGSKVSTAFSGISSAAASVRDGVSTAWDSTWQKTQTVWSGITSTVSASARSISSGVQTSASAAGSALASAWDSAFLKTQSVWSGVESFVSTRAQGVATAVQRGTSAAGTALSSAWDSALAKSQSAWSTVESFVSARAQGVATAVQMKASAAGSALSGAWDSIFLKSQTIWSGVESFVSARAQGVATAVQTKASAAGSALASAWDAVSAKSQATWSGVESFVSARAQGVASAVQRGTSAAGSALAGAWDAAYQKSQSTWSSVESFISARVQAVTNSVRSGTSAAGSALAGAWDGVLQKSQSTYSSVESVVSNAMNAVRNKVNEIMSAVQGAFQRGVDSIGQIWGGIQEKTKAPVNFVINTVYNNGIRRVWNATAGNVGLPDLQVVPGLKSGGPIRGGIPGKDSVLRWLMPGEHVLTTEEVNRAGGHGNIFAWRRALGGGGQASGVGMADGGIPGAIASGLGSVWDATGGRALSGLKDVALGMLAMTAEAAFVPLRAAIHATLGNGGDWRGAVGKMAEYPLDRIVATIRGREDSEMARVAAEVAASGGGGNVEQWRGVALQALEAAGESSSWINLLLRRMNQESGGNPSAVNNWDINARNGTPSQGLMQVIPPTFNAYAGPYRGRGILDPLANIYAATKYTKSRYGTLEAWSRPGGYVDGGIPPLGKPYLVGENGPEVRVDGTPGRIYPNEALTPPVHNITNNFHMDRSMSTPEVIAEMQRKLALAMAG